MDLFDLTGRVAIVTGGNGGIGLGIAEGLVAAGASVMLSGRNEAKGAAAVRGLGERAAYTGANAARKADCDALVAATVARFGRLDILFNNAGITIRKPPETFSEAEYHDILDTNLTGAFLLAQAAFPHLRAAGGGKIINVASLNALLAGPHNVPYTVSKGGMAALTRGLAAAWGPHNIQVNAILPGWIDTDMGASAKAQVPGLEQTSIPRIPLGRWAKPADLAGLAIFLAAPASDYVTGTSIPCDGGYSIRA